MADIQSSAWSEIPADNAQSPPDGWPEGMARSAVNDAARELMAALKRDWNRRNPTVVSTGTGLAYVLSYGVAPPAYVNGHTYRFYAHVACLANPTLNINALGAKPLKLVAGTAARNLAAGDVRLGQVIEATYNAGLDCFICPNLRAGDDFYPLAAAPLITGTLTQELPNIGNTVGANRYFTRQRASSPSNADYFEAIANRVIAGSDYTGVEMLIRRLVDATETHSIRFRGDGSMTFGAGAAGFSFGGPVTVGAGGSFASGKNTAVGWQKLPGGIVLQGGSFASTGDAAGNYTVTFPIAFPTACFTAVAVNGDTSQGSNSAVALVGFSATGLVAHWTGAVNAAFRTNWLAMGY